MVGFACSFLCTLVGITCPKHPRILYINWHRMVAGFRDRIRKSVRGKCGKSITRSPRAPHEEVDSL